MVRIPRCGLPGSNTSGSHKVQWCWPRSPSHLKAQLGKSPPPSPGYCWKNSVPCSHGTGCLGFLLSAEGSKPLSWGPLKYGHLLHKWEILATEVTASLALFYGVKASHRPCLHSRRRIHLGCENKGVGIMGVAHWGIPLVPPLLP